MVRSCFAEETTVCAYINGLVKNRAGPEVGIVIGRPAVGARDFLLALVPTPLQGLDGDEGGGKPKKGGKGHAHSGLSLDEGWAAEHACQVSRMLPGGLHVVGVYVCAPEGEFKSGQGLVQGLLQAVAGATPAMTDGDGVPIPERIVLHVDAATNRTSARSCAIDSSTGAGAPFKGCEYKTGKVLQSFTALSTTYRVDASLAVGRGAPSLRSQVEALLAEEGRRLAGAVCSVGGAVAGPAPLVDSLPSGGMDPTEVQLYLPPMGLPAGKEVAKGGCAGELRVRGAVHARTYAYNRDSSARAAKDLAGDILGTLRARFDIACDEADREEDEREEGAAAGGAEHPLLRAEARWEGGGGPAASIPLPKRAIFPWVGGAVLCDYLQPGETPADAAERAAEMLQLEVGEGEIAEVEKDADLKAHKVSAAPTRVAGAEVVAAAGAGGEAGAGGRGQPACNMVMGLGATGVALLSAALGWMMLDG